MSEPESVPRTVFIVDDHPIVRDGLRQLINAEDDLEVSADAATVESAVEILDAGLPDVVIADLSLPDSDGFELLKLIRNRSMKLPVLVLSMYDENMYAERMLNAGANGYIMKQAAADQLLIALRRVLAGGVYVSERLGARKDEAVLEDDGEQAINPVKRLSNREVQVLNLIGSGKTSREVAENLNLSVKTVESHRQRIKKKLELDTPAELVQFAARWYAQ
ncbi:MAG: response regulator [Candidatus Rariloculaceae bacterium]